MTIGARSTKNNAGMICASVRTVCWANARSSPAVGPVDDCAGLANATTRRITTATATTSENQNPTRSTSGAGDSLGIEIREFVAWVVRVMERRAGRTSLA